MATNYCSPVASGRMLRERGAGVENTICSISLARMHRCDKCLVSLILTKPNKALWERN